MGLKRYKPVTASRRHMTGPDFAEITKRKPERSLLMPRPDRAGRNNLGRITMRGRGAGHKRLYRLVDLRRDKEGVSCKVIAIEYDPNRSARIALVQYADGEKRYILAPKDIRVGQKLVSGGATAEFEVGNTLALAQIPLGSLVHNVELSPGRGGQIARSAGTACQLLAKEGKFAILRMPSGEMRRFHLACRATIGQVGNEDRVNITIGKAGRSRWLGRRPQVRGAAMNPVDHPHGGGEGRSKSGRHPCTPWGKPTKGYKTRPRNKRSDTYIVRRRKV